MLRSGLFAEGWAVYTEDLMADAGYMNNDPLFRLVQLKFYLRAVINATLASEWQKHRDRVVSLEGRYGFLSLAIDHLSSIVPR